MQAPTTRASFAAYLRRFAGPKSRDPARASHIGVVVCKLDDDALVGVFNLSEIVRGAFESSYLGYYAFAPHAGQGYMSEGLSLVLALAFGKLKLHRVEANVQPTNRPSIVAGAARGIHARGLFAPLRQDRRTLARPRALGDAGRGLARAAPGRSLIARGKTVVIALAAALETVACATAPDRLEVPKVVVGLEIAPYGVYEECVSCRPASASATCSGPRRRWRSTFTFTTAMR